MVSNDLASVVTARACLRRRVTRALATRDVVLESCSPSRAPALRSDARGEEHREIDEVLRRLARLAVEG
jgi:hypothetical protein